MRTQALKLTSLLLLLLLATVAPLRAARNGSISIDTANTPTDQTPRDCDDIHIEYHYKVTADTDDGGGRDSFAVVATDANGKALDTDFLSQVVGYDAEDTNTVDDLSPDGITARPITVALYDITNPGSIDENTVEGHNFATSGNLLAKTVLDPATLVSNGACDNVPFIGGASTCLTLPTGSVVGNTPYQTQVYWAPAKVSPGVFLNPGNYWVIGEDESGKYYKIMLSCDFVWVPVQDFQPSFEAPQNGASLPTTVVK